VIDLDVFWAAFGAIASVVVVGLVSWLYFAIANTSLRPTHANPK
jgi:hypothetical protein